MNEREIRVPVPGSGVLTDYASPEERDRSLWLAERRQELAHRGCLLPPWPALTGAERELAAVEARNWLRAAATGAMAGDLRPAVLAGNIDLTTAEISAVLGALEAAAGYRRHRASLTCDDCTASPARACESHAADLDRAGDYDAVAARIEEAVTGHVTRPAEAAVADAEKLVGTMAELVTELDGLAGDMLSRFTRTPDGYRARVGQVQVARWQATLRGTP